MAIWQYPFYLVPKEFVVEQYGVVMPQAALATHNAWQQRSLTPTSVIVFLDQFLPRMWVSLTSQGWGDSMTSDVGLYWSKDTGHVTEFGFRIGLQTDFTAFLSEMLHLSTQLNCLLMNRKGQLLKPVFEDVCDLMNGSNPHKFVMDPRQFLEDLKKGIIRAE